VAAVGGGEPGTVAAGHLVVQQDQIGRVGLHGLERRVPITRRLHPIALGRQEVREELPQQRIVVHD
jgi:hypothetical protein